ncbi:hypothetical protein ABT294_48000 [Nonomuraea sp. NPDC000554]|uniref:hypothetical protein n=1 Tax=Nonomuraea sp. NPDC000554 TaxID=3154259 RepID=UPI003318E91C
MRSSRPPLEFLIAGAFALVVAACAVAALIVPAAEGVVALAAVVGAFSIWSRHLVAGLASGAMAWCFATGFLVNDMGTLTFTAPDGVRLVAFLAVGAAGSAWGMARRPRRRRMRDRGRPPVLAGRLSHPAPTGTSRR